jgi:hypothetical protein
MTALGPADSVEAEPGAKGRRGIRLRVDPVEPVPDEPTAVVVAGGGRGPLVDALLGAFGPAPEIPATAYLVVRPGLRVAAWAYVPGARLPQPYDLAGPRSGGFVRPPRRVELSLPDPLLRHFTLIRAPDMSTLDLAGTRILLDVVRRAGAMVHVPAGGTRGAAEGELVARVAETGATVFRAAPGDPAAAFDLGPDMADVSSLRRALVEWAGAEALARASANPPMLPGAYGTVRVPSGAHESGWAERLDRACVAAAHTVRQRLAIELANVHLRGVQEIVFGVGAAGLPDALDREMHAVSLRAVVECDAAVDRILDDALTQVLGEIPPEGVRRRVALAVRREVAGEGGGSDDPARVLLVTSTGGVATIAGTGAVAALAAYREEADRAVLPPLGVGLSGACYQYWAAPDRADVGHTRSWLQQAVRGVELELLAEVTRRFEAVRRSLSGLLTEAVDHGILLA